MAKLSTIVGFFLDSEQYGDAEYARAYRFAIRGLQTEVNLDMVGKICKHTINITNDKIAKLPQNVIRVKSVDCDYSVGLDESCSNMSDIQFDMHIKKFGMPYEIDYRKRQIVFDANYPYSEVEIETLDREELCDDSDIDERLSNMLVAYIKWQWEIGKKGNGAGQIDYFMKQYYREKDNAKFRIGRPTNQELNRASREHNFYGIKS